MIKRHSKKHNSRGKGKRSISPRPLIAKENIQNQPKAERTGHIDQEDAKKQQTIKICLQLASHHKKEAEELKVKNSVLEYRVKEQVTDMEQLKKELSQIKSSLQQNQSAIKKELEGLKSENTQLKSQIKLLILQNDTLKLTGKEAESILTLGESAVPEINTMTLAKKSRRQGYASNYEQINFIPSEVCLQCKRKEADLEEERQRYCNQLRSLQRQVGQLQRSEIAISVMEEQMLAKNYCIDYLRSQLEIFEAQSRGILEAMAVLQGQILTTNLVNGRQFPYLSHSLSKTVA